MEWHGQTWPTLLITVIEENPQIFSVGLGFHQRILLWLKPQGAGGAQCVGRLQARDSEGKVCIWAASVYPVTPSMELGTW